MGDYRQYVDFEVPELMASVTRNMKGNPDDLIIRGPDRIKLELALQEIASTPEGEKLLREAMGPEHKKIPILKNEGGLTMAVPAGRSIFLGTEDSDLRYRNPETGEMRDVSVQHVLVHELKHITLRHTTKTGDENKYGFSPGKETEAVAATNPYMEKYYGEPHRDKDTSTGDFGGTEHWDYDVTRLARALNAMTPEQVAKAGPEVQSLHEFRNDPKRLVQQFETMANDGSLEHGKEELLKIIKDAPPEPIAPKPQITTVPNPTALAI